MGPDVFVEKNSNSQQQTCNFILLRPTQMLDQSDSSTDTVSRKLKSSSGKHECRKMNKT